MFKYLLIQQICLKSWLLIATKINLAFVCRESWNEIKWVKKWIKEKKKKIINMYNIVVRRLWGIK